MIAARQTGAVVFEDLKTSDWIGYGYTTLANILSATAIWLTIRRDRRERAAKQPIVRAVFTPQVKDKIWAVTVVIENPTNFAVRLDAISVRWPWRAKLTAGKLDFEAVTSATGFHKLRYQNSQTRQRNSSDTVVFLLLSRPARRAYLTVRLTVLGETEVVQRRTIKRRLIA